MSENNSRRVSFEELRLSNNSYRFIVENLIKPFFKKIPLNQKLKFAWVGDDSGGGYFTAIGRREENPPYSKSTFRSQHEYMEQVAIRMSDFYKESSRAASGGGEWVKNW